MQTENLSLQPAPRPSTGRGLLRAGGVMEDPTFTESDLRALFRLDSSEAGKHARCGPGARCRRDALAKCDEDLDNYLAVAVPRVRDMEGSAVARG
jgi:hypothetical protein